MIKKIFLLLVLTSSTLVFSQTGKETALKKGREAIKLMDEGKLDESIQLLKEAEKLDPEMFDYPYEMALAYYLKNEYKETIKILELNRDHQNVTERLYQLLGNAYDMLGKGDKAVEAYDSGLLKFPNAGVLYLEKGNLFWAKKEYGQALPFYEKGIQVDPKFPSNYYRASLIYCGSTEEMWGMIYGEIFINLERNSKRTVEISKLLYDVYKSEIKFENKNSASVSFCQQMTLNVNTLKDTTSKPRLPFCMVYEPTLLISVALEKKVDLESLDRIRSTFLANYFSMGHDKSYPNVLFEYQKKIEKAGHLSAYNHWLLMKGAEDDFDKWYKTHGEEWDAFVKWFSVNKLVLDQTYRFHSSQY